MWIQREISRAGICTLKQHVFPGLTAVSGAEYATVLVRAKGMPQGRYIDDVRVVWMDTNTRDVACILQPEMHPGLAAIGRFVYTIAVRHIEANAGFTHTGIDDIRVGVGDSQRGPTDAVWK